jgi:hypothetical protein
MLKRPGIMQHTKLEQFPTRVWRWKAKKHFQNTRTMQTAVPRSKHGQYEKAGGKKVPPVQNCI